MKQAKNATPANQDAKAKFKAALDAKNARAKAASSGSDADGGQVSTKGPQNAGGGPKMFRRKAGG
jgi:hypothetical protein